MKMTINKKMVAAKYLGTAFLFCALTAIAIKAAPDDLDPSFGFNGKIVAVGTRFSGSNLNFVIARYQGGSNATARTLFDFDGDGRGDAFQSFARQTEPGISTDPPTDSPPLNLDFRPTYQRPLITTGMASQMRRFSAPALVFTTKHERNFNPTIRLSR